MGNHICCRHNMPWDPGVSLLHVCVLEKTKEDIIKLTCKDRNEHRHCQRTAN